MKSSLKKYHEEYSCVPQIVEAEKDSITKRYTRIKRLWVVYGVLIIISFIFLTGWITSILCLSGLIFFSASINHKDMLEKRPFLVIDAKYIQFKGKLISWNSIVTITISQQERKKKDSAYHYTITFKNRNGKEICVDTCYFSKQKDIVNSIISLARYKEIQIETDYPEKYYSEESC